MSSLEHSSSTTVGSKYCNIATAQGTDLNTAIINMIEDPKGEMN